MPAAHFEGALPQQAFHCVLDFAVLLFGGLLLHGQGIQRLHVDHVFVSLRIPLACSSSRKRRLCFGSLNLVYISDVVLADKDAAWLEAQARSWIDCH